MSIALDTHAHVLPDMREGAADVVSSLLFARKADAALGAAGNSDG